jgi:RNA polymerase sigma factor for flagellar operon FliA
MELEDLVQAGLVALTECAQKHSGPTEDGFAAYAKMRVRGAMVDLVRRVTPLSRSVSERRRMLADHTATLRNELGRDPTDAELAAAMGLTDQELATLHAGSEPVRFETIDSAYSDSDPAFADDRTASPCWPTNRCARGWPSPSPRCRNGSSSSSSSTSSRN